MKKLFILGLCLFCVSNCFAGQVFNDFTVTTDICIGYTLIGAGTYLALTSTPIGQVIGIVSLISGIHLLTNYYKK